MKLPFAQLILNECTASYAYSADLHENFDDMISGIVYKLNAIVQDYNKIIWIDIQMVWTK